MSEFWGKDAAQWTAIGTWVYTLFTLAIAVGAFWAVQVAKRQISALQQQSEAAQKASEGQLDAIRLQMANDAENAARQLAEMERARKDAMRPVLVECEASFRRWDNGLAVEVAFENVGGGPMLWGAGYCWWVAIEPGARPADDHIGLPDLDALVAQPPMGWLWIPRPLAPGAKTKVWIARGNDSKRPVTTFGEREYQFAIGFSYRGIWPDVTYVLPEDRIRKHALVVVRP